MVDQQNAAIVADRNDAGRLSRIIDLMPAARDLAVGELEVEQVNADPVAVVYRSFAVHLPGRP